MARNKRHNLINLMAEQHEGVAAGGGISAPQHDPEAAERAALEKEKREEEQALWSAQVGAVRNRLTGKRRGARDRFSKFASTGGAGRGR